MSSRICRSSSSGRQASTSLVCPITNEHRPLSSLPAGFTVCQTGFWLYCCSYYCSMLHIPWPYIPAFIYTRVSICCSCKYVRVRMPSLQSTHMLTLPSLRWKKYIYRVGKQQTIEACPVETSIFYLGYTRNLANALKTCILVYENICISYTNTSTSTLLFIL